MLREGLEGRGWEGEGWGWNLEGSDGREGWEEWLGGRSEACGDRY